VRVTLGRSGGRSLLRIWAISTAILFCLSAAWAFATPIGAGNDEPAQLVKAASVVRGEIVGRAPSAASEANLSASQRRDLQICLVLASADRCNGALTIVTVPESFANFAMSACFTNRSAVPAGCGRDLRGSGREVSAATYVGRYPPLYYALVGLPSLALHSDTAVYLMRLLSGLLSAVFLGLAFASASLWSRSRLLVLAIAVTATPMVIIFGSAVNPSGLELATAVCVWTCGLTLVLDRASSPPLGLVVATTVSASVMALTRGLSPMWLAIIAFAVIAISPRSIPQLIRFGRVRIAVGVIALANIAAVAYIVWAHALSLYPFGIPVHPGTSLWGIIEISLGRTETLVNEFIGPIGWLQTSPPLAVLVLWVVPASAILVLGLITSFRHHAWVIIGLLVGSLVLPTTLMVSQARTDGVVWQARDGYPLYAGILLVAGAVAGRNRARSAPESGTTLVLATAARRLGVFVASTVAAAQLGEFVWALRRYTVGLGSVLNLFASVPGGWSPPIASVMLVVFATIVIVGYGMWVAHLATHVAVSLNSKNDVDNQFGGATGTTQPRNGLTNLRLPKL
jgi:hypothetical protein